jgi:hypothetical protein
MIIYGRAKNFEVPGKAEAVFVAHAQNTVMPEFRLVKPSSLSFPVQ